METWILLVVWLVIGLFMYFGYSRKRSPLRTPVQPARKLPEALQPAA